MRMMCKFGLAAVLLLAALPSRAQMAPDNVGQPSNGMPQILQGVAFRPELNARMPLDTPFRDEAGKNVRLGDYFHSQKPVVVAFVYYGCPMMCTQLEQGVVGALRMLSFNPGRDYEVVFISFDERDTPEMAAEAHLLIRSEIARRLGRQVADTIRILYGGSVKPDNATALLNQPEIDGHKAGSGRARYRHRRVALFIEGSGP